MKSFVDASQEAPPQPRRYRLKLCPQDVSPGDRSKNDEWGVGGGNYDKVSHTDKSLF